ncbi:MAG: 4-hydroxy-tetrahydrodipicolinate synthase [Oscillospiraceae bacterium]|nr:4-hydroxy-tetrahydrodipicolinate synthase [Oscillospiraceae bacterium]
MKKTIFTGAGTALVTPMNSDGTINYEAFGKNIDWQIEQGIDAVIVCGTTGEASTMTDEEHVEVMRYCVERVNKRVPVIAGTGSNDTAYAVWLSVEAEKAGADALLQVTPYYNKTSQKGLVAHFTKISDRVNIPIMLYNIPIRSVINIEISTYKELSKHPNIVAVKEASGNIAFIAGVLAACGDSLDVYSGDDSQIVPIMSLGGKGVISTCANIIPRIVHDTAQSCLDGDYKKAAELQLKYLELMNKLFIDVNPIPVKEAMNILGMNAGECRLPLVSMEQAKKDILTEALKNAGLLK